MNTREIELAEAQLTGYRLRRHLYVGQDGGRRFYLCSVCHAAVQMTVSI